MRWAELRKNSLIIFLLQYNLQLFALFDFYSPPRGQRSRGGACYTDLSLICTGWQAGPARFQLIKLRPTHWAICFLWLRCCYCCFSRFPAKTKCDSHYYRVLSSLSSSLFLIPFRRRCKNVPARLVVVRRHYYYCFYRYSPFVAAAVCGFLRSFERENGFVFLRLDYYDCVWLQILHSMKCFQSSFSILSSILAFYAAHWSCKWLWLRFFWFFGFAAPRLSSIHAGNLAVYVY